MKPTTIFTIVLLSCILAFTSSTTTAPKTSKPVKTTVKPTTKVATTKAATTAKATTTAKPTTKAATTAKATTTAATTVKVTTTAKATTAKVTTAAKATTAKVMTTAKATTAKVTTTAKATTAKVTTTAKATTAKVTTTAKATTAKVTTAKATTAKVTTAKATTAKASTIVITTTQPQPTTQPPTPSPYNLDFKVHDEKLGDCLMMQGVVTVTVGKEVIQLQQSKCTATGKCSAMTNGTASELSIKCTSEDPSNRVETTALTIGFTGGEVWYMSSLKVNHNGTEGSATYKQDGNGKLFQAKFNESYTCASDVKQPLGKQNITVDFKKVTLLQPFAGTNVAKSACPSGVNPNPDASIVPIAVGCALAGLIVIVLIAYLIGRRKGGGGRGYQKV